VIDSSIALRTLTCPADNRPTNTPTTPTPPTLRTAHQKSDGAFIGWFGLQPTTDPATVDVGYRLVRLYHEHFDDPLPGTEFGDVEYAVDRNTWEAGRRA
jgi:hypothetical protein